MRSELLSTALSSARSGSCCPRRAARRVSKSRGRAEGPDPRRDSRLVLLFSEGSVFDSPSQAHELCLAPAFADWFGASSGAARGEGGAASLWSSVALDSRLRGADRLKVLAAVLRLASGERAIAQAARREDGLLAALLEAWLASESSPTPERLELALRAGKADPRLYKIVDWSWSVEAAMVALPAPRTFPGAAAALGAISSKAMVVAVSSAPVAAARKAWELAGLADLVDGFANSDRGRPCSLDGLFGETRDRPSILVVGDAALDLEVARSLGADFYPIFRHRVDRSWEELASTFLPRFGSGHALGAPIAAFLDSFAAPRGRQAPTSA